MHMVQNDVAEFHLQLKNGSVQRAYRALVSFMMGLRSHFEQKYSDYTVSGFYQGYMDMTYFAVVPPLFKYHGLKVAIVFNYDTFRFETWLAARNRTIQKQYWDMLNAYDWGDYHIVTPATGVDAILECTLADEFNLDKPDALTEIIEHIVSKFIKSIETNLSGHCEHNGCGHIKQTSNH